MHQAELALASGYAASRDRTTVHLFSSQSPHVKDMGPPAPSTQRNVSHFSAATDRGCSRQASLATPAVGLRSSVGLQLEASE